VFLLVAGLQVAAAQDTAHVGTNRCDSIVAAAHVDSVDVTIGARAFVMGGEGATLSAAQEEALIRAIVSAFAPPRPFRLSVFESGLPAMRTLKTTPTRTALRAPTVTGVYRFVLRGDRSVSDIVVSRVSLIPGFDSAVVGAIELTGRLKFLPQLGDDVKQVRIELRLSTESMPRSYPVLIAKFPRMPVADAAANADNPPPEYPAAERADSVEGDAVLRFIVDAWGRPVLNTVMLVRATSPGFVAAALAALPGQRFSPATIGGCSVAQIVEYPFSFLLPPNEPRVRGGLTRRD